MAGRGKQRKNDTARSTAQRKRKHTESPKCRLTLPLKGWKPPSRGIFVSAFRAGVSGFLQGAEVEAEVSKAGTEVKGGIVVSQSVECKIEVERLSRIKVWCNLTVLSCCW